ncbi:NAD(P)-binding protein [Ganoderma leucocontextum]|nr:NAD(P)-binding protein [Ganoderma leucocontextum]
MRGWFEKGLNFDLPFHNLTLVEASIPKFKATEVLVKVHAVSLQPLWYNFCTVPGSDIACEVITMGETVKDWKVGERVCSNFASSETSPRRAKRPVWEARLMVPFPNTREDELTRFWLQALIRVPEHLSYDRRRLRLCRGYRPAGCAALTGYNTLMNAGLKGGDMVLVEGTGGGVSTFAPQLATASGTNLAVAKKLGPTPSTTRRPLTGTTKLLKVTGGRGVDHVIEPQTVLKSLNCVRYGGNIHTVGFVAGAYSEVAPVDLNRLPLILLSKAAVLRSNLIGSRAGFEDVVRLINAVKLNPVIEKVFGFEHARDAYVIKVSRN